MAQGAPLKPGAIEICITRAERLHGVGRFAQCLEQSREAIGLDPSDPRGWMHAAWALSAMEDYAAALEHIDAGLARDPANTWGLRLRSGILDDLGRHAEALESADAALLLDPLSSHAYHRRGVCLSNLGRFDEAEVTIRMGLELDPEEAECWATLAWIALRQGRSDVALEAARQTVALQPDAHWAHVRLGDALAATGDDTPSEARAYRAEAVRAFATALRLAPTRTYPRRRLLELFRQDSRNLGCGLLAIWGALQVAAIGLAAEVTGGIVAVVLVALTLPLVAGIARRSTLNVWEHQIPGIRHIFDHLSDEPPP